MEDRRADLLIMMCLHLKLIEKMLLDFWDAIYFFFKKFPKNWSHSKKVLAAAVENWLQKPTYPFRKLKKFNKRVTDSFKNLVGSTIEKLVTPSIYYTFFFKSISRKFRENDFMKKIESVSMHCNDANCDCTFWLLRFAQWAKTRKKLHFGRTIHCLPQRLKSTFFEKKFERAALNGPVEWENFQKTLILAR